MRSYGLLRYRLDQVEAYVIWYTNAADGVVVDDIGYVPAFGTRSGVQRYAAEHRLDLQDNEISVYDLDIVRAWLEDRPSTIDNPTALLLAWNLFLDVAYAVRDVPYVELHTRAADTYGKLSRRTLLSVAAVARGWAAKDWTPRDIEVLRAVLASGLALFRDRVRCA